MDCERKVKPMAVCEEIRRSIEVNVPPEVADREWTQFIFYTMYMPQHAPSAREAEPDEGFVRLEGLPKDRTKVSVDLNYCPQWKDVDDDKEIADARAHLDWVLGRYKEFVERRTVRVPEVK
jgi:hypothetical protein